MRIGVIPAVGNGLIHMQRTGQLTRLFAHLGGYGHFCRYFSFAAMSEEAPLWNRNLGTLHAPAQAPRSPLRYALTLPIRERRAFQGCDVLRCTSLLGAIPAIVAKVLYGTPFVFSHGADYVRIAQIHGRSRLHVQKWRALRAVAMRLADAVIVQNAAMAVELRGAYPMAKVQCIPNWVDTDRFAPLEPHRKTDDLRTVLYVGRLVAEKNLVALAWACRTLGLRLVCVGAGPLKPELRGLRAECVGAVPWEMLPNYHRIASVFAMVSHTEGHCKALTEAMASGLPCVVSRAVTEGMVPGLNCIQVKPEEGAISAGLEAMLSSPAEAARMGREARATAVLLWGKDTILGQERRLLRDCAR